MNASEIISKVRSQFVLRERFFATVLMNLKAVEDPGCKTFWTDGRTIGYNPKFVESLTEPENMGVHFHQILHVINGHHLRRGERDPRLWNDACDYAINPIVIDAGYALPEGVLLDQQFRGLAPEEIYNILNQKKEEQNGKDNADNQQLGEQHSGENEKQKGKGSGSGESENLEPGGGDSPYEPEEENSEQDQKGEGCSEETPGQQGGSSQPEKEPADSGAGFDEVRDMKAEDGSPLSEAEVSQAQAEIKIMVAQAARIAEQAGQMKSNLAGLVETLKAPKRDWRAELAVYMQRLSKNDYSWMHPNRRHVAQGLYLPSLRSEDLGRVVLVGDTSGSTCGVWGAFMSEMRSLMEMFGIRVTVILCDNQVQDVVEDITPDEIAGIQPKGFGGTDFRPPFDYIEQQGLAPDLLIYFTDLDCWHFPEEPAYPVVWASWTKRDKVPFGDVINVEEK